jgi:hypothetical protein
MNEQRAFTVVVNGCRNCHLADKENRLCNTPNTTWNEARVIFVGNENAITPTCPMWNEAKPIGELK